MRRTDSPAKQEFHTCIGKSTTMSYGVSKKRSKDRRSNKHQMGELHDS
jgi:hypothetical protein